MTEMDKINWEALGPEIETILLNYLKIQSITYSEKENEVGAYFLGYFNKLPYFKEHPELLGAYAIPDDVFGRSVNWSMIRGKGEKTIVLIHHYDVVSVEDYKLLEPYAFSPKELSEQLMLIKDTLQEEAKADLLSGDYIFGHGACDMKGGGSIQMALMKEYSKMKDFQGNVILIGVPDEENMSAGMRGAVLLLEELQEKYGLVYELMINSEPHQRKDPAVGVFSEGSVGKILPFVYVRGFMSHVGKVFEGFNPLNLMSAIVRKAELNLDFSDVVGAEAAPPPTWLYLKDNKEFYDVSMPMSIYGCLSVLTLNQTPSMVMDKVKDICVSAFEEIVDEMNQRYSKFASLTGRPQEKLPWEVKVISFRDLLKEAAQNKGKVFEEGYKAELARLQELLKTGEVNLMNCNSQLLEYVYDFIDDLSPRVVFGLIPPYYPNVSNLFLSDMDPAVAGISGVLQEFSKENFGQEYEIEYFFTGISDLSYTSIKDSETVLGALREYMPMFETMYSLPVKTIEKISMPGINIGPWGKDFHKLTERVLTEDLLVRTPKLVHKAIKTILS